MVRKALQEEPPSLSWKNRMLAAKAELPENVGQQMVIEKIIKIDPSIDSLAFSTRWRNAWFAKVGDPQLTTLVEKAVEQFKADAKIRKSRLRGQKLVCNK